MPSDAPADTFAALFEKESKAPPRRTVRVGDVLDVVVAQIGKDTVFVELDGKRPAFIEADELRAPDRTLSVAVGDTLRARVIDVDDATGNVRLGRTMGRVAGTAGLEQALASGVAVEGKVTKLNKGGLEVELGAVRAFCPMSQIDTKFVQDASIFVGKSLSFLVTEVRGKNVLVSRRSLLEREARDSVAQLMKNLVAGAIVRGTVTGIREFGAFVDLGGIEGLIPLSEVAYDRSASIADAVAVGDVVDVLVREVKEVAGRRPHEVTTKITLSLKALAQDPWENLDLVEGRVAVGTVTRLVDFGVFVRLSAGVEGLIHRSELGRDLAVVKLGETLSVVVRNLDRTTKKISLVPAPEGLAVGAEPPEVKLGVGAVVTGVIERIETYGVFVQIDGTRGRAGRGLVPNVELGVVRGTDIRKAFPEGTKVTAKIIDTAEGKLRMSLRALRADQERADFDGYRDKTAGRLGTLGDLMKQKQKR